ncbi:MAG: cadherin repeat domain-containing protein, partial [Beijerinckiaceae bacterium]|nr:cadherin repeat domain-containing protein [Beijerinckiaceae bacterium]
MAADAVTENAAIGTAVGITASASDADATTNTVGYTLASNPGGLFAINASTGVVTVASAIDREVVGASTNITVRATSADGSFADTVFTIAVAD